MAFYLVTGGAGFIGSHLVEELLRRRHRVRVVDNLSTGKRHNLDAAVAAARVTVPDAAPPEFQIGDLANLDVSRGAVDGVDYVLHQAAMPSVPRSVEDPLSSNRANIDATLNLLVAARDAGVRRVVYAGSSSAWQRRRAPETRGRRDGSPLAVSHSRSWSANNTCSSSRASTGSRR